MGITVLFLLVLAIVIFILIATIIDRFINRNKD